MEHGSVSGFSVGSHSELANREYLSSRSDPLTRDPRQVRTRHSSWVELRLEIGGLKDEMPLTFLHPKTTRQPKIDLHTPTKFNLNNAPSLPTSASEWELTTTYNRKVCFHSLIQIPVNLLLSVQVVGRLVHSVDDPVQTFVRNCLSK